MLGENLEICQSRWQLTLEHDTLCFVSVWDILICIVELPRFVPFIFSFHLVSATLSWPLILWIQNFPNFQLCRQYVQKFSFCSYTYLYFSVSSKIILHPLISHLWCGIHYGSPSTWSLSIDINSLFKKLIEKLPFITLELAFLNGKFFTLDDKFTSLAFDKPISWVFDFSFCIHIPWIVLIVPWGPLSLLVVSLTLVNSLHHWLVIKWLSSMFDINTSIRMLESILWSDHVGAQDPGLRLQKFQVAKWCDMVMMICMSLSDG